MTIYLIVTVITSFLVFLEEKNNEKVKKKRCILSILAILLLCIIAGARDSGVGTDTLVYGDSVFQWMCEHNFSEALVLNLKMKIDYGYLVLVYVITRFTDKLFWQYFVFQLISVGFVFKALDDANLDRYKWIGVFIYNTLFYSFSLNLMRQIMAVSIVLYAYKYVRESKLLKFLIWVIIAIFIHKTAFVAITIYPLYMMLGTTISYKEKRLGISLKNFFNKYRVILAILICLSAMVVVMIPKQLVSLVARYFPSFSAKLSSFHGFNPSLAMFGIMILFLLPFAIFKKESYRKNPKLIFYLVICLISTILWQLEGISTEAYRVALYFWGLLIIIIPDIIKTIKITKTRVILKKYYLFLGIFYFWFVFVFRLTNETYPYTSKLLGIG